MRLGAQLERELLPKLAQPAARNERGPQLANGPEEVGWVVRKRLETERDAAPQIEHDDGNVFKPPAHAPDARQRLAKRAVPFLLHDAGVDDAERWRVGKHVAEDDGQQLDGQTVDAGLVGVGVGVVHFDGVGNLQTGAELDELCGGIVAVGVDELCVGLVG